MEKKVLTVNLLLEEGKNFALRMDLLMKRRREKC